jgi:hypothetical protein
VGTGHNLLIHAHALIFFSLTQSHILVRRGCVRSDGGPAVAPLPTAAATRVPATCGGLRGGGRPLQHAAVGPAGAVRG